MPAVSMLYLFSCKLLLNDTNLAASIVGVLSAFFTKLAMSLSSSQALLVILASEFRLETGNRLMCDEDCSPRRLTLEGSFSFPNFIARLSSINCLA
jgi:hypothetical protein